MGSYTIFEQIIFSRVLGMCMLVVRQYGIIFWSYDISVLNCVLLVLYSHQVSNTCYKKLFRIPCCLNKQFQGPLYKLKIRFDIQTIFTKALDFQ